MHHKSRNDSASILRSSECVEILSRVDSELSFEQQMALLALETALLGLFPNNLNLTYLFIKCKRLKRITRLFTVGCVYINLVSLKHSELRWNYISEHWTHTGTLLHEHLSVRIKTRLECHPLFKSKLRIDSRENRDAFGRSQNRFYIAALMFT